MAPEQEPAADVGAGAAPEAGAKPGPVAKAAAHARGPRHPEEHGAGGEVLKSTPGWVISIVLHSLIVFAATLFYFDQYRVEDDSALYANIVRAKPKLSADQPPEEKEKKETSDPEEQVESAPPASNQDTPGGESADAGGPDTSPMGLQGGPGGSGGWRPSAGSRAGGARRKVVSVNPSVRAGLKWLARHQNPDGSWSASRFRARCGQAGYEGDCSRNAFEGNDQYDHGVTALSLLALLGAGYTPASRDLVHESEKAAEPGDAYAEWRKLTYGEVVKRACRFLMASQAPGGRIGPEVDRYIYNHMLGTLALVEAYGDTGIWILRRPAQRAVRFILESRTPGGGWRYSPTARETDASVTGWAVLCLKSAETAGLEVDSSFHDDVRRWLERATISTPIPVKSMGDPAWDAARPFTLTGYLGPRDAGNVVTVAGMNEQYQFTPAMTASMLMSAMLMDGKPAAKANDAVATILAFPPAAWSPEDRSTWRKVDLYYGYHATYALFQMTRKDDEVWKRWSDAMRKCLADGQNLKGASGRSFAGQCAEGSWDPVDRWSCEGGRVYATAMAVLTLEVCLRYPRILGTEKTEQERLIEKE